MFPNAPGLTEFWRLIRCGLDGITEIPSTHWSPDDYFDSDASAPDMTYCRRGGFLGTVQFDPTEFGIPPAALEATDTAQLLALVVAKAALADAAAHRGTASDAEARESGTGHERTSVILGVTGTQELVIPLGARLGHPIWRRALRAAGIDSATAENVIERIADGYVSWQESSFPGLLGNVVAGRIANRLDLNGTNCVVDAACASSLSAIHLAIMELQSGRADTVVSGGVDALNDIFMHMCFSKTPALSPTGDARPFAAAADGTVLGEGIGMVVLKRLADAQRDGDRVYAVIKAVGTSSDGRQNSIYAPYAEGQALAVRRAYAEAGFGPETVELVEAHGTGTKVGDVVEFEALRTVFEAARVPATGGKDPGTRNERTENQPDSERAWCAVGSVKSQIGHTKAAAGAAGLIKAVLALHHKVLPPTAKVECPNPKLNVTDSPLYINGEARPWLPRDTHPRRAGVSSFGFGGSNFHLLLEEAPSLSHQASPRPVAPAWDGSVEVVALGGDSAADLSAALDAILSTLEDCSPWSTVAGLAARSRETFHVQSAHRLLIVIERGIAVGAPAGANVDSGVTAARALLAQARDAILHETATTWSLPGIYRGCGLAAGGVAMLFPGQGSQYLGMGRDLATVFEECRAALTELDSARAKWAGSAHPGMSMPRLVDVVYPPTAFDDNAAAAQRARLTSTGLAQPAIGAMELGMLEVLARFRVRPDACAGHSYGELAALHAGGRISAETFGRLSWSRAQAMAAAISGTMSHESGAGAMLAVEAPLDRIEAMLRDDKLSAVLANRNGPTQGVLSGRAEQISAAEDACRKHGFRCKRLNVSAAFHTRDMQPAANDFANCLRRSDFVSSAVPVFANVTARPYPSDADAARDVLCRQMTAPVDFAGQVANLYASGIRTFVEVGPKAVLTGLVRSSLQGRAHVALAVDASAGSRSGIADLARALAQLSAAGHLVHWREWESPLQAPRRPRMVVPLCGANYRAPQQPAKVARVAATTGGHTVAPAPTPLRVADVHDDGTTAPVVSPRSVDRPAARHAAQVVPAMAPASVGTRSETAITDNNNRTQSALARGSSMDQDIESRMIVSNSTVGTALHEALRTVADGMQAMQALQQQTAEAHQRFLEGQALAHRTFQTMLEGQQRLLERAMGLPQAEHAPVAAPAPLYSPQRAVEPAGEPRQQYRQRAAAPIQANGGSDSATAPTAPRFSGGNGGMTAPASRVTPAERPAWVPPAMAEESPWGEDQPAAQRQVARGPAALQQTTSAPNAARSGAATLAAPPQAKETAAHAPSKSHAEELADVEALFGATLLAVVAELTGYPQEMLQLDMDMEADLGIDSIKRVEILAAVQERMPDTKAVNPEYMGSLRTLAQIVDYCVGDKKKVN